MPIVPLFGGGFYSKSANVTSQRRTNLYMEVQKDNDKTPMALYGTPGLTLWTNFSGATNPPASTSPSRGMIEIPDVFSGGTATVLVSVHGNRIYGFDSNGNYWNFAGITLLTTSGYVSIAFNGTTIMLVDGTYGYRVIFSPHGGVVVQIVDADFPANPGTVAFLNSYFIVQQNGSGRFYWTNDATATNWDPLDFATAETSPDNLVALASDYGQIYLLGQKTTEVWGATGDASVWRRIGGAAAEWGLIAQQSVAKFDTGLVFLAANKLGEAQVVRINGYQIVPITDSEVSNAINKESVLSTVTGFSYMIDGHAFYQINFSDRSFLYDGLSGLWSMVSGDTNGGRHRAERRAAQSQKPYVSDYQNSNIYLLDKTNYTDNGQTIVREVVTRHVFTDYERRSVLELQVDFEEGTGLTSGQGSDPQVMLQISKDGGHDWGNELWTTLGALGQYATRVIWRRLGIARDWLFKIRITDPVKVVIIGGGIKIE